MKNKIKLLSALLIVIFSISLCTVSAFAVPVDETIATDPVQTTPIVTEPIVTTPEPTETEPTAPPTTAPTTKATTPKTEPTTKQPVYTTKPATKATQSYTQATQYYATWATTAPTQAPVFETDAKRIDDKTLDNNDWEDIKNQLMNKSDDSGNVDNFDFIHKNSDKEDDGLWLLVVGIILIVLGVAIIAFWIIYSIKKKRYLDQRKNGHNKGNSRRVPSQRSTNDEYYPGRDRKETTPYERRQINKRSKFDTGEVELPRNRHSSPRGGSRGNGTRYRR